MKTSLFSPKKSGGGNFYSPPGIIAVETTVDSGFAASADNGSIDSLEKDDYGNF